MPLKRASRGRTKGGKGSSGTVQCTNCGQTVPKDKAKKVTSKLNLVEHTLAKELTCTGSIYCIANCFETLIVFHVQFISKLSKLDQKKVEENVVNFAVNIIL